MSWLKNILASILAIVGYQYVGYKIDEQKYPAIGRKIDIGGYSLHVIDSAYNSLTRQIEDNHKPVVVIDPGMGNISLSWGLVYPKIAEFARVIVVDRAGYAWSDESPLSRTSKNIVHELQAVLHNGNIPGPYILVGHSFGGMNVRLFAHTYPDQVAGIILVDSSHEDQGKRLADFPKAKEPTFFMQWKSNMEQLLGLHTYNENVERKFVQHIAHYPEDVQRNFLACLLSLPGYRAKKAEKLYLAESQEQLKQVAGSLNDIPLTVISRGVQDTVKDYNGSLTQEQVDSKNLIWSQLQADLVTKSAQGHQIIAEKSGHMIHEDQPEIIVQAVRAMVKITTIMLKKGDDA